MTIALVVVVVVGVIVLLVVQHIKENKRREALEQWAARHGWSFHRTRDHGISQRYDEFTFSRSGSGNRYGFNRIEGRRNSRRYQIFDFHYETTSTNSKGHRTRRSHFLVVVTIQPAYPLEPLRIRPETFFDKLAAMVGFDDINFESGEFSRQYHVSAPNRRWAYDVLHARAIAFLLTQPKRTIEFGVSQAATWESGRATPQKLEAMLATLDGLLDFMPAYVVEHQRSLSTAGAVT